MVAAVSRRGGAATRVLVAGGLLIALAWALAPAPSPPLYDGLQGPAQPYVYLQPPPGYHQTGKPGGASRALPITSGSSNAGFINTEEIPPQAQVLAGDGTFSSPPGATSITLTVTPVAPPQPLPASLGQQAGNVYEVKASADVPGPVTVAAAHPVTVVLRGPTGTGSAPMARLAQGGTAWERVTTVPLGSAPDMVVTNADRLGWFAITQTATSTASGGGGGGSGGGVPVVAIVVPALVLLAVVAGLLLRSSSRERGRGARRRR
jgi:hypothetical protein